MEKETPQRTAPGLGPKVSLRMSQSQNFPPTRMASLQTVEVGLSGFSSAPDGYMASPRPLDYSPGVSGPSWWLEDPSAGYRNPSLSYSDHDSYYSPGPADSAVDDSDVARNPYGNAAMPVGYDMSSWFPAELPQSDGSDSYSLADHSPYMAPHNPVPEDLAGSYHTTSYDNSLDSAPAEQEQKVDKDSPNRKLLTPPRSQSPSTPASPGKHAEEQDASSPGTVNSDIQQRKVLVCTEPDCPSTQVFKRPSALKRHMEKHQKPFFCPHRHCTRREGGSGGGFTREDNLRTHLNSKMHLKCCEDAEKYRMDARPRGTRGAASPSPPAQAAGSPGAYTSHGTPEKMEAIAQELLDEAREARGVWESSYHTNPGSQRISPEEMEAHAQKLLEKAREVRMGRS